MSSAPVGLEISPQKRRYWEYQYRLMREYLVPLLEGWGVSLQGARVVDLGCAEAGGLVALAEAGAQVCGLELRASRAELARRLAQERGVELRVLVGDLLSEDDIAQLGGPFDLVLLRDVIEHVPEKEKALRNVRRLLSGSPVGKALVTFPPYYSPFGGHQQMLASPFRLLPYWHFLPRPFFAPLAWFLRRFDRQPYILTEMELFRKEKLSLRRFEKLAARAGFAVAGRQFYISRPSHKLRYGWPVIPAGKIGLIPILREFVVSGATYLLAPKREDSGPSGD